MKLRILLLLCLSIILTVSAFAQIKVDSKKQTHKRTGKDVIDWKKTFEINQPVFSANTDSSALENLAATFSYWRVFDTTLKQEDEYQWLSDLDYKVTFNRSDILQLELSRSGSGAYPSTYTKTVVADTKSGLQIHITDFIKNRISLLQEIDRRQEIEMAAAKKEHGEDISYSLESVGKASDQVTEFSVGARGVYFHFDYGFPHVSLAIQPEGRYLFTWDQLKPYLADYGPITDLSKKPVPKTVAIVDLGLSGILGGVQDGSFVDPKEAALSIKGESNSFALLLPGSTNVNKLASAYTSSINLKLDEFQPEELCPDYRGVERGETNRSGIAISKTANWNPVPRAVTTLPSSNRVYRGVVSAFLKSKGLSGSEAKIDALYKVDLDGDGVDEVVISATNYKRTKNEFAPDKGGYSLVLVRKNIGDSVKSILLGGEFITTDEQGAESTFKISGIADVNGDGTMEIVVYSAYYEGADSTVYSIEDGASKSIMQTGCGV